MAPWPTCPSRRMELTIDGQEADDAGRFRAPRNLLQSSTWPCQSVEAQKPCWSKLMGKFLSCLGRPWFLVSEGLFFFFKEIWFIYLFNIYLAVSGFSCGTWDLLLLYSNFWLHHLGI